MDGASSVGSSSSAVLDIAAGGTSSIAMAMLSSTEKLVADEATRLFASLGLGSAISAFA
jgi:hypothetical protein